MSQVFADPRRLVGNLVYDVILLDWVAMTQPGGGTGGAGDASAALQLLGNASLASIDGKTPALVSARVPVDGSGVTQPVSASALPLPTGAATGAKQDTGNTSLSAIDSNAGASTDAAVVTDVAGTLSAKLRGLIKMLADVWDSSNHWLKVSLQNATLAVTQSGAWSVTANAGTNLNTAALALEGGGNLAAIKADVDKIPSPGQALAAASMPVVLTALQLASIVALPANAAQETGGNLAALLTELQGKADFNETQPVKEAHPTAVTETEIGFTTISDVARTITLLAGNANRRSATIINDTDLTIPISEGGVASRTVYSDLVRPGQRHTLPYPACIAALTGYFPILPDRGRLRVTERTL